MDAPTPVILEVARQLRGEEAPIVVFVTAYDRYAVEAFEIAAVILVLAIIAAIALTLRKRPETRYQDPARQVSVRREDRVRLVDVPSEKRG